MKDELYLAIHRFEVLGKTSSDDMSGGTNPASYKRFFDDLEERLWWESEEIDRLLEIVLVSGDTSKDDERMGANKEDVPEDQEVSRLGEKKVVKRRRRVAAGRSKTDFQEGDDGTCICLSSNLN